MFDAWETMDQAIDKDTQEKMFENVNKDGGRQAGNLSPDYIRKVVQELSKLNMSMGSLRDKIKKLMDKSVSYFSAKKETIYEDLFNSDNLAGLSDYIELHPKLRKIFVEDVLVKDEKSIGKIDIYIDTSGSMGSSCGSKIEDQHVSRIDFAKSFIIKMKEMDLLKDVYIFDTRVRKYKDDDFSIAVLEANGGTNIDKVVEKVKIGENNAIIITDAEDRCSLYSHKAFFIGLEGCKFHHFEKHILQKYVDNSQAIVFDGKSIYNINRDTGLVIK
jgi:hypothetical protein